MGPSLDRATAYALLRESLPLAAAIAMNVVYLRLLVLFVSLQTDETETGLFATSFRVFEILLGLPTLVLAVALPLLAVAGAEDRERLRYAVQRLTETALALSLLLVLVTVLLAEPAITLLFGEEYDDAAPMLQVQAFALVGIFLSQVWTLALVSLRRQRDVAIANGVALLAVVVLGLVLVGAYEGVGGAAAAVATETLLAVLVLGFLVRADRTVAPAPGFVWRPLAAAAAAALVALLPLSAWLVAPLAAAVFLGVALAVGAMPPEVLPALRAGAAMRPRVVLLRGHNANPWDLRPWELLRDEFEVVVLVTGSNVFDLEDLELEVVRVKAVRDLLPAGRAGDLASRAPRRPLPRPRRTPARRRHRPLRRARRLVQRPAGGAEARARLPARADGLGDDPLPRHLPRLARQGLPPGRPRGDGPLPRRDRARTTMPAARRCARRAHRGLAAGRRHRAVRGRSRARAGDRVIVSPGRLVWEKGHFDVIRALALLERPARLLIVGAGPERKRLLRYAADLGVADRVEIRRRAARGDAGRLRGRLLRRPRQPGDPALGGAVRHGARRGDGGRRADRRELERRDSGGARRARRPLRTGRLAGARAAARQDARTPRGAGARPGARAPLLARGRRRAPARRVRESARVTPPRGGFYRHVLESLLADGALRTDMSVLVVAGGSADRDVLQSLGFEQRDDL